MNFEAYPAYKSAGINIRGFFERIRYFILMPIKPFMKIGILPSLLLLVNS
jgi:hypothetical protein